jgi:hypothetical protein
MAQDEPRSRRAVLAAAAGGAAALAANAVLRPVPVQAVAEPLLTETANTATAATSLAATLSMDTVFAVSNGDGSGPNTAIQGSSDTGTAVAGYTASGTGVYGDAMGGGRGVRGGAGVNGTGVYGVVGDDTDAPADTSYSGVFGWSPAGDGVDLLGTGVWGDSPDVGVYGSGGTGVAGDGRPGGWGVYGFSDTGNGVVGDVTTGNAVYGLATSGIALRGASETGYGLYVSGKVRFSTRSGRASVSSGKTSYTKTGLTGVTTSSIVIAVLQTVETGTWVRAAVAGSGKITIYFNRALPSSAVVGWLILN